MEIIIISIYLIKLKVIVDVKSVSKEWNKLLVFGFIKQNIDSNIPLDITDICLMYFGSTDKCGLNIPWS